MRLIFILIFLVSNFIFSQTNSQTDFRSALTGETTNFGTSFFYNQPSKVILGSAYLFDEWNNDGEIQTLTGCLLYTSPSPRDRSLSRMPSSA